MNRVFFKGRSPNGQKTHEEISGHKGNANQNYVKIPPHSCLNCYHQERKQQQMLVRIWGKRNLRTLLVRI
jgi:hypothetical protein